MLLYVCIYTHICIYIALYICIELRFEHWFIHGVCFCTGFQTQEAKELTQP